MGKTVVVCHSKCESMAKVLPRKPFRKRKTHISHNIQYYAGVVFLKLIPHFLGLFIVDPPYGLNVAHWDKEAWDAEQIANVLKQFDAVTSCGSYTVCMWHANTHTGVVDRAFRDHQLQNVGQVYWYKPNQNMVGNPDQYVYAVESFTVGTRKSKDPAQNMNFMSSNPLMRHNLMEINGLRAPRLNLQNKPVNVCEKPPALAKRLTELFCGPSDWVLVGCSGAGGEVVGVLQADRNVACVESDLVQVESLQGFLTTLDAKLGMKEAKEQAVAKKKSMLAGNAAENKDPVSQNVLCPSCGTRITEDNPASKCEQMGCSVPICSECSQPDHAGNLQCCPDCAKEDQDAFTPVAAA